MMIIIATLYVVYAVWFFFNGILNHPKDFAEATDEATKLGGGRAWVYLLLAIVSALWPVVVTFNIICLATGTYKTLDEE